MYKMYMFIKHIYKIWLKIFQKACKQITTNNVIYMYNHPFNFLTIVHTSYKKYLQHVYMYVWPKVKSMFIV